MKGTKEDILLTALRRFARDGFEAASVSDIAGELGMTKGALYKHYKSKRDIFESIVARMAERDSQSAQEHELPEGTKSEMEEKYSAAKGDMILDFSNAQFAYWTEDEFASSFRKMLMLEQFRDEEMSELYQQYIVSGPLGYMTDLLESLGCNEPRVKALCFYAPMFFLYSVYDSGRTELAKELADEHFSRVCREILENKRK